jgi:hypothetical protein
MPLFRFREPLRGYPHLLLAIRVVPVVCAVRAGLWLVSFRTLRRIVAFLTKNGSGQTTRFPVEQLSRAVVGVSRYVPHATCLTQALALHILLRRGRLQSKIRIGVAKGKGGRFEAHAWVESQDRVLIGDFDLNRYTPMMVWD